MKRVEVSLIPAPDKAPEFLCQLESSDTDDTARQQFWNKLPPKLILENYTREAWAWKPSKQFTTLTCRSVDGRNKLPGFVKYLKDRQKCAYGRFGRTGILVISYIQSSKTTVDCRFSFDITELPNCSVPPLKTKSQPPPEPAAAAPAPPLATASKPAPPKKKTGLLGNLVSAQQRTNQHVVKARAAVAQPLATTTTTDNTKDDATRTAQEAFQEFRQFCSDTFLDFDLASEEVLKLPISLKDHTQDLLDSEKPKVTMEVLKYMVYEAAEEVNEEWIAYKEPSEFMDECVIAIYKEGAAPPDVLEDVNRAELPDEVRGQQRALSEQRAKVFSKQDAQQSKVLEAQAFDEDDDLEMLNTNKRDRRTIEDYEREKRAAESKRSRLNP